MSQRVTRSSAARLAADNPTADSVTPNTTNAANPTPSSRTPATRKRKATAAEQSPPSVRETRRTKRQRGDEPEEDEAQQQQPEQALEPPRKGKKKTAAAMSSAGYGSSRKKPEDMADASRPSSSTSGETSPHAVPKDSSSRRKSSRRKSGKEGELQANGSKGLAGAHGGIDVSTPTAGASSRKSKRGSRKDHDTLMKDVDEKGSPPPEEEEQEGAEAPNEDAQEGADAGADARRRLLQDDIDALGAGGDPFSAGDYLSRLAGASGLSGLSGQLRAMSSMLSGTGSRLRGILEQLRTKEDPSVQLLALQELSELLLVSNEDNLAGHFAPDQFVKELVILMQPNDFTGEENPEVMLLACRCIANLIEALPAATASVVYGGAVQVLCQKLLEIHFIDLAEQALTTLEKISVEFPSSIVREGGLSACLQYLDFFATSTQRTAVTTAANCCRNIPEDSFPVSYTHLTLPTKRIV